MTEDTQLNSPADQTAPPRVATQYDARMPDLPFSRRIQIPLIAGAARAMARTIGPTLRFEVLGWRHIDGVHATGRRCVYSFWHRSIFLATWWWRDRGVVAMTSANFDGQWLGRTLEGLGFGATHGSSSRGGLRGLAVLARNLENGHDAAFAADGPRGPRYISKVGPVMLARRTGCPIIPFHLRAEHGRTFEKTWDQFQLPYPFSRVVLIVAPPIEVPPDASRELVESKHLELQTALEQVRDAAEPWFRLSHAERDRERTRWNP